MRGTMKLPRHVVDPTQLGQPVHPLPQKLAKWKILISHELLTTLAKENSIEEIAVRLVLGRYLQEELFTWWLSLEVPACMS